MQKTIPSTLTAFLWHNIKPHKQYVFGLLITGILWGGLLSFTPYVLKCIIDAVSQPNTSNAAAIKNAIPYGLWYIFLWAASAFNFRINDWFRLKLFPEVRRNIINSMFAYVNRHSHDYFQNEFAGSLSNKITDMSGSSVSLLMKFDETFAQIVGLTIAAVMMFYVNPLFAYILVAWATLLILISALFSKKTLRLSHDFSLKKSAVMGKIVDSITNFKNIQSFARHQYEENHIKTHIDDTVNKDIEMQVYILKMRLVQDSTFVSLIGAMLWGLFYLYGKNQVTIGDFILILTLSLSIAQALWWLANQLVQFAEELGKCTQALSIISKQHDIKDKPLAKIISVKKGVITFNKINFSYGGVPALFKDFTLKISAKKSIGLVGFSGSGKSTLINLLMRFFTLDKGEILIDDQNIEDITQDSLRRHITTISQDSSLFHRSLKDNIRYGRISASDEEVILAAKKAHAHEFIMQLSEGYDSMVGERGVKLSGGQRQRIAIARALIKDAPMLILDEATSALDSVTEAAIQASLKELIQNKTSIIIAHRLSTLTIVDEIIVLDNGKLIERGSHEKLIKLEGHYAKMWQMQSNGFLPLNKNASD